MFKKANLYLGFLSLFLLGLITDTIA